jgi:hypothetical protein
MSQPPLLITLWMWIGIVSAGLFALGFAVWLGGIIAAWSLPAKAPDSSAS